LALAWLAAAWHDFPARQLVMIGVTGTDGKTTTANFLFEVLQVAGYASGLLSTVRAVVGAVEEPLALHVTTPEAPVVQEYLRRMVDAGLTHCVLEATSHGLAQHRVSAIDFDVAVITNITHEHLDYHGSYDAYFAAKARLFTSLSAPNWNTPSQNQHKRRVNRTAILNQDDAAYDRLAKLTLPHCLTYALSRQADITASDVRHERDRTRFDLHLPDATVPVTTPFVGDFNVANMLAAAGAAHALGVPATAIGAGLGSLRALSGRMERIDEGQLFTVIVDFAHTPNALAKAIATARGLTSGRVITVFGSAGKRDVAKRRLMAATSARAADFTVLTAEDPRTESLAQILEMMAEGCHSEGAVENETFWRIPDRGRAIYHALTLAREGDLVLVCGKGHEQSICFGEHEYRWDDCEATRTALRAYREGKTMPDLGLPTY
jgi:UDP-N-acetylmuramoyl-L-alanyl-D-glutamate--2,6-diaminopimelate ligase